VPASINDQNKKTPAIAVTHDPLSETDCTFEAGNWVTPKHRLKPDTVKMYSEEHQQRENLKRGGKGIAIQERGGQKSQHTNGISDSGRLRSQGGNNLRRGGWALAKKTAYY